jgi:lysophospholipase L1-like esterase
MKPIPSVLAACSLITVLHAQSPTQQPPVGSPTPVTSPSVTNQASLSHEPTTAAEATAQNKYLGKLTPEEYARWDAYVNSRPAEEQEWLRTLEKQLGSFYAPPYMRDLPAGNVKPESDGWAYVKDNPALPRVLIIGDSISRSYTAPVRIALTGKANVHRAPANCGNTDNFFKFGESWLKQNGKDRWDVVVFNFGIHDRDKSPDLYAANLRKIYDRLKAAGASIVWVETTPFARPEDAPGTDRSPALNATGNAVATEEGAEIVRLHDLMLPELASLQKSDRTHFNEEGQRKMGTAVAEAVSRHLKPASSASSASPGPTVLR